VPAYDRDLAQRLVNVGASVGAMTPGQLASFVAEAVRGSKGASSSSALLSSSLKRGPR
jgi:hypothetical protein